MSNITEHNDEPDHNWWASFFQSDSSVAETFRQSILSTAFNAYRNEFKRLPGSTRTSRLRKKRNTRIIDWYCNEYLNRQSTPSATDGCCDDAVCQSQATSWPEGEFSIDKILDMVESLPTPNTAPTAGSDEE